MADGYEDTDEEDVAGEDDHEDEADDSDIDDDIDVGRLPRQGPELDILGLPSDLGSEDFERTQSKGLALAELRISVTNTQ